MKKFLVVLVVLAMVCLSSMAFAAAEIGVSGQIDIRGRLFNDLDLNKDKADVTSGADTQERVRLEVNVKAGDAKAKIAIENDWDTWGRLEEAQGDNNQTSINNKANLGKNSFLDLREAWINFNLPGIPVNVNAGHQLLQLGQGWFFRSMKYGSDAWVVANQTGPNTVAFVDIKVSEGDSGSADDIDAYVLLDVFKISEKMMAGIDITSISDRKGNISLNSAATTSVNSIYFTGNGAGTKAFSQIQITNVGLNFTGALGPVNLKAELDYQAGKATTASPTGTDAKFKGNQIVLQGDVKLDPVAINFTAARGSGMKKNSDDIDQIATGLDADQHYTLLYEYKIKGPAVNLLSGTPGDVHQGFANTTALSAGVMAKVASSLAVGADLWYLQATEKSNVNGGDESSDIGTEVDAKVNWTLSENVALNTTLAYFKPGGVYKDSTGKTADPATGVQSVLTLKF